MTKRAPHILMAGGGTGGHVYPAIAIADALRALAPEVKVAFAGTDDRVEATAVPKAGYTLYPITVSGFQRSLSMRNLRFPFTLMKGFVQSWNLVGSFDPDVAVGTGGYVSGPVLLAARMRGRPIVIQEQNAYAGVTNRLLSRFAARIHLAFPEAKEYVPEERAIVSGNPVRQSLTEVSREEACAYFDIPERAQVLLVLGGSLGSEALNTAVEEHAQKGLDRNPRLHLIWQTGSQYFKMLQRRVKPHPRLHMMEYIDRMDMAYAAADLAVCRAGAITCSELMVTGTPAVLIPSPNVVADHQTKNATSMADAGAARLLPEEDLLGRIVPLVGGLLSDAETRRKMAEAARTIARPDAAERIARDILEIAEVRVSNDELSTDQSEMRSAFDIRKSDIENQNE